MRDYIKKQHTTIFTGRIGCEKTHLVLDLIEKEYNKHFDYIVIICPTFRDNNVTYHSKDFLKNDDRLWLVDPKDKLYQWIEKLSLLLRRLEALFIIDEIIAADESLDEKRQPLIELSIKGRRRGHYLWLLTQSYSTVPKNLRRQTGAIFTWCPKEQGDLKTIHDENDVLTDDELVVVRGLLRKSKHACQNMYIRNEHPLGFQLLNHAWSN